MGKQIAKIEENGLISIPDVSNQIGEKNFTIVLYINTQSPGELFSSRKNNNGPGFTLQITTDELLEFDLHKDNQNGKRITSINAGIWDEKWHSIAIVRNNGEIGLFVDGNKLTAGEASNVNTAIDIEPLFTLTIGSTYIGGIFNFAIYDKALGQEELISQISNGINASETVGFWKLDGNCNDSSPNKHDGKIIDPLEFIPASLILPFNIQFQKQTRWCWSANTVGISLFYNPLSKWEQCKVVNLALDQSNCCNNGGNDQCNQSYQLDKALEITGNFDKWTYNIVDSKVIVNLETVKEAINNWRILGAFIDYGHFVSISGIYEDDNNPGQFYLIIDDPWTGTKHIPYDVFQNNYEGRGKWTATYFTKPTN
jgi:hypothetical protein